MFCAWMNGGKLRVLCRKQFLPCKCGEILIGRLHFVVGCSLTCIIGLIDMSQSF
jgi:hypothetical protein